jgi:histone deacetylase HOS3
VISAGFDASLYEHSYMSRHGRKVPTSFYYRFTREVGEFANKFARKRVVSVLEGGYAARALCSGVFAHVVGLGLGDVVDEMVKEEWWTLENLVKVGSFFLSIRINGFFT